MEEIDRIKAGTYTNAGADRRRRIARAEWGARFTPACVVCGVKFGAYKRTARYCSAACKQTAYRRRQKEARIERAIAKSKANSASAASRFRERRAGITARALATKAATLSNRECIYCDRVFTADGTQGGRIYCSNACRQAAYRERKRAARVAAELDFLKAKRG